MEMELNPSKEKETPTRSSREWEFADEIYIFCPEVNQGIMFYDQSPSGVVAKIIGTLPVGKFWSSAEKIVEWDEEINGKRIENIPVTNDISFIVHEQKMLGRRTEKYGGGLSSYSAITIIVSQENFINLLHQLEEPNKEKSEDGNTIINLNSQIYRYNQNIFKNHNNINNYDDEIYPNLYLEYKKRNNRK